MASVSRAIADTTQNETVFEKRSAPRRPASQVPTINGLRLSPHGAEAKLVDISSTGLLAECTSRLKVGSSVAVLFEGGFSSAPVVAIARCSVAAMGRDGVLRYHVGISFNKPIVLDDVVVETVVPVAPVMNSSESAAPSAPAVAAVRNCW